MIPVTCGSCQLEFEATEADVGTLVECPACEQQVEVPHASNSAPELVGAHAAVGASRSHMAGAGTGPAAGATPARSTSARTQTPARAHSTKDHSARPRAGRADGERRLPAGAEEEQRQKNMFRLGAALTIAYLMPIVGVPRDFIVFPQFTSQATWSMFLPLLAGITLMYVSQRATVQVRGIVSLAMGLAMFGMLMFDKQAGSSVGQSMGAVRVTANLSGFLLVIGALGVFIGSRVRWYRPLHEHAFWIGAVASACALLYLFIPVGGSMPLTMPFTLLKYSTLMGLGLLAHVGLLAAAAVLCLLNRPSTPADKSSKWAGLAFIGVLGAFVVPILVVCISGLFMTREMGGGPTLLILSSTVKIVSMFGCLLLLAPVGAVDLLVGRK